MPPRRRRQKTSQYGWQKEKGFGKIFVRNPKDLSTPVKYKRPLGGAGNDLEMKNLRDSFATSAYWPSAEMTSFKTVWMSATHLLAYAGKG